MAFYIIFNVHTEYSLLDAFVQVKGTGGGWARSWALDSLAITDHGVMYGRD